MTAKAKKCVIFGNTPTRGEALKCDALLQIVMHRATLGIQAFNHARARRTARLRVGECSAHYCS